MYSLDMYSLDMYCLDMYSLDMYSLDMYSLDRCVLSGPCLIRVLYLYALYSASKFPTFLLSMERWLVIFISKTPPACHLQATLSCLLPRVCSNIFLKDELFLVEDSRAHFITGEKETPINPTFYLY